MNEIRIKKRTLKTAVAAVCVVLAVLVGVSGVLGYNLLKAYRINRYSKNIWLGNNYFLTKYEDESIEEMFDDEYEEVLVSPTENGSETAFSEIISEVSETYSSSYLKSAYLNEKIYNLYITGELSDNDVAQIYQMLHEGNLQEAVDAINEVAGMKIVDSVLVNRKLDVPYVSQEGILPNGCEAVSGVMLLRDKGFDVDPVEFVDDYLDCGEVKVRWGCRYGPDPSKQYAGDPKSEKGGWGCFAPVIVDSLNKYLSDKDYYACNLTGKSISYLVANYVANGTPVAVWCTISMQEIDEVYQWQSYDKKQTYLYPVRQHCMVLIGYDDEYYYFLDPYNSNGEVKYTKEQTEYCFNSIGKQAVAILNEK